MTSIHKQTLLASCLATVAVIPALIPAALLVIVYTSFLGSILSGPTWYPDFVNEVALIWLPEFLRGMVAGSVALLATKYFFPAANKQIAAISAGAFWGGASVLIAVFSWLIFGFTTDLIGVLAMAIGRARTDATWTILLSPLHHDGVADGFSRAMSAVRDKPVIRQKTVR